MTKTHPLVCPRCGHYRYIEYEGVRFEEKSKSIGIKLPLYKCKSCGLIDSILPREKIQDFVDGFMPELLEGEFFECPLKFVFSKLDEDAKFERFDHLEFTYDPRDYFVIPGLYREFDIGYLTPVFFDKDVLLYYNGHPEYEVRLGSFSSGNIYHKGKPLFDWGFGITRSGKIFKWLGDLSKDFASIERKSHLKRFQASNVMSDHDIVSKFYFSQNPFSIEDAFQDSDNEVQLLKVKNSLDELVQRETGIIMSKIDTTDLTQYYQHPILNERHQVFSSFLGLTKLLIESIQVDALKKFLSQNGMSKEELKNLKGLKLLELFIKVHFKRQNFQDIIIPMFVLYDLRLLHGHLTDGSFEIKYNSCKDRLGLHKEAQDFEVYTTLIKKLLEFYNTLLTPDGI
jgi:hypothetical protein